MKVFGNSSRQPSWIDTQERKSTFHCRLRWHLFGATLSSTSGFPVFFVPQQFQPSSSNAGPAVSVVQDIGNNDAVQIQQNAAGYPLSISINVSNQPFLKIDGSGNYIQTGVGASGTAAALPSNPDWYLKVNLSGANYVIPAFKAS